MGDILDNHQKHSRLITVNPSFDLQTFELVAHDGQFEYCGPVAECKGGMEQAQQNINTADKLSSGYATQEQGIQNQLLPFLTAETTNPQGFGTQGTNELLSSGGQAVSGAVGAGDEAAKLRASRLGNPSSSGSIIDAVARSGMQQQSDNALGINTENLGEKLKQQQAGATGLGELGGKDMSAALSSLGLSNNAIEDYTKAYSATGGPLGPFGQAISNLGQGVGGIAGMVGGGLGAIPGLGNIGAKVGAI
jgi:hypothetical protein